MMSLERIQYHAALIITGTWKGTSKNKLGWESMSDCRWCRRFLQFFTIHNRLTLKYLYEKLPANQALLYGGGNASTNHNIYARTSKYQNRFFPDTIKTWTGI